MAKIVVTKETKNLFEKALKNVESDSVRKWASSKQNKPILLQIAQTYVSNGQKDPDFLLAMIVAEAIGLW